MGWPTPQDYNEAVQNPQYNFGDPELQAGELYVNPMGLPRVASGAFASVYRMRCGQRDFAVRCFLQPVVDQQQRYEAISQFVLNDDLDCTVAFEYLAHGIRVQSAWYPLLKMEWVSGQPLDGYVRSHLQNPTALIALANNLQRILREMHADGIAHGDLQHGNIIVTEGAKIRLVDYDGMYVPSLAGHNCPELGHRNYQHPGRTAKHFGPYLDNFAAWSIYVSLVCLSRDPLLLDQLKGGDECLLFRLFDYVNPTRSRVFAALEQHTDPEIRHLSKVLRTLILTPIENIPLLGSQLQVNSTLPELSPNLPDWLISNVENTDDIDFRDNSGYSKVDFVPATDKDIWPTLDQYASAMASPAASFTDENLRKGRALRVNGKIVPTAKNKNALFRLQTARPYLGTYSPSVAVKVFLQQDESLQQRYEEFSVFLNALTKSTKEVHKFIPGFHYLPHGIRIGNRAYPVLQMDWLEGPTFEELMKAPIANLEKLPAAKRQFRSLCSTMTTLGIIHGELEASNFILTIDAGLRITDFDCLQLHRISSAPPAESTGSLRHPTEPTYVDEYSDRFPSWIIDSTLTLAEFEPEAAESTAKLLGGQWIQSGFFSAKIYFVDSLLGALEQSSNKILKQRAQLLKCFLNIDRAEIPPLLPGAAISETFASDHKLVFGLVPDDLFMVSPDVLPVACDVVPLEDYVKLPAKLPRFQKSAQLNAVGYFLAIGLYGSILVASEWTAFYFLFALFVYFAVRSMGNKPP